MQDVKDLSVYGAVVAGSAMRSSKWLPEAIQFITTSSSSIIAEAVRHIYRVHYPGDVKFSTVSEGSVRMDTTRSRTSETGQ